MILKYLMKPGLKVKRWIASGIISIIILSLVIAELLNTGFVNKIYSMILILLGLVSILVIMVSISESFKAVVSILNSKNIKVTVNKADIEELIEQDTVTVRGPKIVVIGGGTGLSTMLRGLKAYTSNITAIVTVGDDGGGSGKLRADLGMLPPGDIRSCMLALANTEPVMEDLLQYRFPEGTLKGQSFGNLFLAAMDGISDNFEEAVQKMSSVLSVSGKILPVTLDDMKLIAKLENGNLIEGESRIPDEVVEQDSRICELSIEPKNAKPLIDALIAIDEADAIIMGPGSLYTSIISNLLVNDIPEAVQRSKAIKIYVSNVMTQPGETHDFKVSDHVKTLLKYSGKDSVDYVIANNGNISEEMKEKYLKKGSQLVELDKEATENLGVEVIETDLVKIEKGYVKHDTDNLAVVLMATTLEKKLMYDKKKIIEYMYLSRKVDKNN